MKHFLVTLLSLSISAVCYSQPANATYTSKLSILLRTKGKTLSVFCNTSNDSVRNRVLFEYGSAYISQGAVLPDNCVMTENQVAAFRSLSGIKANCYLWGGDDSCFQIGAKESLDRVFADRRLEGYPNKRYLKVARHCNGSVPCKDGVNSDWAFRSYRQAKENWDNGKPDYLVGLSDDAKIINFDYGYRKPRLFSNAVPGGSQHHLGLAIDVNDEDKCGVGSDCETVLNANFWFRTIRYDPFHFTYLGYPSTELQSKGLKRVKCPRDRQERREFQYWVPNDSSYQEYTNWECEPVP